MGEDRFGQAAIAQICPPQHRNLTGTTWLLDGGLSLRHGHWFATGVHRRLTATALALASCDGPELPLLLSLDLGGRRSRRDAASEAIIA